MGLRHSRGVLAVLAIVTSTVAAAAPLDAADDDADIALGKALVTMYCSDCHATGKLGESRLALAPHFRDLHLRYDVEWLSEALVEGIVTAHPDMPEFEFDPEQAAAIVSYLKTLEPAGGEPRPDAAAP